MRYPDTLIRHYDAVNDAMARFGNPRSGPLAVQVARKAVFGLYEALGSEIDAPHLRECVIKECACHARYNVAQWRKLPDMKRYTMAEITDKDGKTFPSELHEQRQCRCGSHIVVLLAYGNTPTIAGYVLEILK